MNRSNWRTEKRNAAAAEYTFVPLVVTTLAAGTSVVVVVVVALHYSLADLSYQYWH